MDELLSLKWNNHNDSFLETLSHLRVKDTFTDVTLACEGKLYNAHKLILSTCSDYFSNIFQAIECKKPVIILKDVKCKELEALLDYMYLGEVNVSQNELATLIKTAECLQLKGLAVPEEREKRKLDTPISSSRRKKLKLQDNKQSSSPCPTIERNSSLSESCIALENSDLYIKDEAPDYEIDTTKEEFSPYHLENDVANNIEINQPCVADSNSGNMYKLEPVSDLWKDVRPDTVPDSLSSFPRNLESFDMPTVSGQRNTQPNIPDLPVVMICQFCQKSMLAYDLRRHMRTHTGEKPFGCPHCNFWASRKTSTMRHIMRIHKNLEILSIKVKGDNIGT